MHVVLEFRGGALPFAPDTISRPLLPDSPAGSEEYVKKKVSIRPISSTNSVSKATTFGKDMLSIDNVLRGDGEGASMQLSLQPREIL